MTRTNPELLAIALYESHVRMMNQKTGAVYASWLHATEEQREEFSECARKLLEEKTKA